MSGTKDDRLREPFLRQVARAYADNEPEAVADYCFVVPNKRSALFLSKYFSEVLTSGGKRAALLPAVVTISDFVNELSDKVEISRIEMLFILYEVYSGIVNRQLSDQAKTSGKGLVDFNKFQYWGDILIDDFGDVDRYMVDADQLFRNIEGLREISANYLTEEQLEVIRNYWNEDIVPEPVKEFWRHAVHVPNHKDGEEQTPGHKNVAGFVKLWQVMHEVYDTFRSRLSEAGYGYSGMIYREVAERLRHIDKEDFEYDRYIFTGFSVLSESEESIFKSMQQLGIADFYWDYASPAMYIKGNRASQFIGNHAKTFASRYAVGKSKLNSYPDITVIAVPSTFGQAKAIATILKSLYPEKFNPTAGADGSTGKYRLEDTAIVLPDESLVSPLLNAIPEQIDTVNVTMGFPLSHTTVASLIKNIVSLQLRAREVRSQNTFFFEDVVALLTHPVIRSRYTALCDRIVAEINEKRLFNLPLTFFEKEEYAPLLPLFKVVRNLNDSDGVIDYLDELLAWLEQLISPRANDTEHADTEVEDGTAIAVDDADDNAEDEVQPTLSTKLELQYILSYRAAVAELRRLNDRYLRGGKVFLEDKTVFHLVERILGNQTIAYEGMPLKGLQVMGVLESRGLDFDNIVMPSMNERIFPRRHYARTFIPDGLRRGYGMATIKHQESMYAYYFYRLITRAKNVYLLYDARTSGVRTGDMSRYINQIKYQFPASKVHFKGSQYALEATKPLNIAIKKTPAIIQRLRQYFSGSDPRYLSAHSINTYIHCPLQFYLAYIEGYYPENEVHDYMDEGTYGTIVHNVAEKMYDDLKDEHSPSLPLTPEVYAKLKEPKRISRYVTSEIKTLYLGIPGDDPREIEGDALIFRKLMVRTIAKMYEREEEREAAFRAQCKADNAGAHIGSEFLEAELNKYGSVKVSDKLSVNLNYRIDRVDRVNEADGSYFIRIIDYKTGSDETKVPKLEQLFSHGAKANNKAIFQLLLYCNAYAQTEKYGGAIQPYIYQLRKVAVDKFTPLKINGEEVKDYATFNEEFLQRLDQLFDEMLDEDIPFKAFPDERNCKFCKFNEMCQVSRT